MQITDRLKDIINDKGSLLKQQLKLDQKLKLKWWLVAVAIAFNVLATAERLRAATKRAKFFQAITIAMMQQQQQQQQQSYALIPLVIVFRLNALKCTTNSCCCWRCCWGPSSLWFFIFHCGSCWCWCNDKPFFFTFRMQLLVPWWL